MLGDVFCSTLHMKTVEKTGTIIAGAKAVPLVLNRAIIDQAASIVGQERSRGDSGTISIKEMRRPKTGVVIIGKEVYEGRIQDSFAPVIRKYT
jgi:hypothetical protein